MTPHAADHPSWIRRHGRQLLLMATTTALTAALVGEIGTRVLGRVDEDGNVFTLGRHTPPFVLPVKRVEAAISEYLAAPTSVLMADPETGWSPRPGSRNELYTYNRHGIRVGAPDREYSEAPRPGVVRVALFGDSFTNGVDERFEDTWAAGLHERLAAGEHGYEIINFGVPGYGMDQALLRWRTLGRRFAPHVVVFGLQIENVRRNTNVIRPLYNPVVDIPFSKPRFILEGDHLEVINQPTVPPEALAATIARIDEWEWVRYEDYYDPADYRTPPWLASRFLGVLTSIIRTPADEGVATPEQRVLALRLLEEFEGEARPSGATFIVVHLPRHADLQALAASGRLPAASLLADVERRFTYIETAHAMLDELGDAPIATLFNRSDHYTAAAHATVARLVAERLARLNQE